jgi:lysophospholipase L1-like esterase
MFQPAVSHPFRRYVAIGDSFSEGVGDNLPGDQVRGWADFVAQGLAAATTEEFRYANLAIRGRKLGPILAEQLDQALALGPDIVSLNGGGNDIMRPHIEMADIVDQLATAADRIAASGAHVLLLSGANPSRHLPLGRVMQRRGTEMSDAVKRFFPRPGAIYVDNFADDAFHDVRFWSPDKLHLNARGHARIASNVLTALGVPVPGDWEVTPELGAQVPRQPAVFYYRDHVLPWVGRRLTGRSSGDGRTPKLAELTLVSRD